MWKKEKYKSYWINNQSILEETMSPNTVLKRILFPFIMP